MIRKRWLHKKDPGYKAFVEELRKIVSEGYSMEQVAEMFGTAKKPVTKGAVAGCTHRNGITFGNNDSKKGGSTKNPDRSKKSADATPTRRSPWEILVSESRPILLPTVETNRCQWPFGDPGEPDFAWCQKQRVEGPYCQEHHKTAHHEPKPKKMPP